MRQTTIEKFSGLAIQPNSLTLPPGRLERAENAVINQDYLITKCRGENLFAQFPATQKLNRLWEYGSSIFAVSQNLLYRILSTPATATLQCFASSSNVSVRRASHGIQDGDLINQLLIPSSDALSASFLHGSADIYGARAVQTIFLASVTTSGAITTIDLTEHGMVTGNTISIGTNSRGIAAGTYAITFVNNNRFTIATSSSSAGAVTYTSLDAFRVISTNAAIASTTSATNAATFLYYQQVSSPPISITASGIGVSRQFAAQGNSYFTTDNGLYKLEREDLPAIEAGLPPGLDIQVTTTGVTGVLNPNSQTAYRLLFGRKDAQGNLILSAPSQQAIVYQTPRQNITVNVNISAGIATVTVNDTQHPFTAANQLLSVENWVTSNGVSVAAGSVYYTTAVTVGTSFQFQFPTTVNPSPFSTTMSYGWSPTPTITASIPSELLSTTYLFQIYRTSASATYLNEPFEDYRLVAEQNLTATDVSRGYLTYSDDLPDLLLAGQPYLYTNATQEGILQANSRPPRADDIAVFKGYSFYANTVQYHLLNFTTVDPSLISAGDTFLITDGINTETYRFYGIGTGATATNEAVGNESVTNSVSVAATTATVNRTNHGFQNLDYIRITAATGSPAIPTGEYQITVVNANQFTFTVASGATGTITFEGTRTSSNQRIVKRFISTTASAITVSQAIYFTATYIIKAINRNTTSRVFAQYTSEITQPPGSISLLAKDLLQNAFRINSSNASTIGAAFEPVFPTSGTAVQSEADIGPNRLYISKLNEPEAVPIFNLRDVGSKASPILRVAALRDSLIILKGDGIYRLNGDTAANFSVTTLDNTVFVKATDSVVVLNNSVYCLSNQGVVQITDSSVRIVSRIIEPVLTAILGQDLDATTSAVGYESERMYLLSVKRPNTTSAVADVTYCYNYLTESWTSWIGTNKVFFNGFLRPTDDKLYLIPASAQNEIIKERKNQNLIDFSAQEYCAPVIKAIASSILTTQGSAIVTVTMPVNHGYTTGQLVTVSRPSTAVTNVFSGGEAHLIGLRTVTVLSDTSFTFVANSAATAGSLGDIYIAKFISEAVLQATSAIGLTTVTITTSVPHNLTNNHVVTVEAASSALLAAFANQSDLLKYRSVQVIDATTFVIQSTNPAISTVTGTVTLTDKKQDNTTVTIDTVGLFLVSPGDAIVAEDRLYKIESAIKITSEIFIAQLQNPYKSTSSALSFVHQAYRTLIKFSPLTFGQVGTLKQFSEFQVSFRNGQSCSSISLDFASDSVNSSSKQKWTYRVGLNGTVPAFGGWGELDWGYSPWGGDATIQRIYVTQPSVILRTYVPREVFISTFLQPILDHRMAGEALEVQAISVYVQTVSQRTTR